MKYVPIHIVVLEVVQKLAPRWQDLGSVSLGPARAGNPQYFEPENAMTDQHSAMPTHRAYSVIWRENRDDYLVNIGLVFAHKDGDGFNLILQALPLDGKIVCREITDDQQSEGSLHERISSDASRVQRPELEMRVNRIRQLNDSFRRRFFFSEAILTQSLVALGTDVTRTALMEIRRAPAGSGDASDDEHNIGVLEVRGRKLVWKIHYYDAAMELASEDPADPLKTSRVLSVMLASESASWAH